MDGSEDGSNSGSDDNDGMYYVHMFCTEMCLIILIDGVHCAWNVCV